MVMHRGGSVAYGSADFQSASELIRALEPHHSHRGRMVGALVLRPRMTAHAVRTIAHLPVLDVALTRTPNGRAIRAELEELSLGLPVGRIARAALELPSNFDTYL